jgi:hypothetical protein
MSWKIKPVACFEIRKKGTVQLTHIKRDCTHYFPPKYQLNIYVLPVKIIFICKTDTDRQLQTSGGTPNHRYSYENKYDAGSIEILINRESA